MTCLGHGPMPELPSFSYHTICWVPVGSAPSGKIETEGHHQVDVPVAVHVDGVPVDGPGRGVDDVLGPGRVRGVAGVPVPGYLAALRRRAHYVDKSVAVDVGGAHGPGLRRVVVDHVLDPDTVAVLEPGELVADAPSGAGHVQVAVAVEIGNGHVVGAGDAALRDVAMTPRVGVPWVAVEAERQQAAVEVVDAHDLRLPVAVDVGNGVSLQQLVGPQVDDVPGEVAGAVVLEPVEAPIGVGGDQVQAAAAGQVGGGEGEGVSELRRNEPFGESYELGHRASTTAACSGCCPGRSSVSWARSSSRTSPSCTSHPVRRARWSA